MKFFIVLIIGLLSVPVQAQIEFGAAAGLRYNQAETDVRGAEITAQTGFQAGVISYFPFTSIWGLRGAIQYTQRYMDLGPTNQGDVEIRYAYFDIPVTPMVRLTDFAGLFAGPVFAFNQSKDVSCSRLSNCAALDVNSIVIPFQVGIQLKFLYQLGAELYFEYVHGDLSTNVSNMRAVGANFIFYIE